jgi:hypothetical protein
VRLGSGPQERSRGDKAEKARAANLEAVIDLNALGASKEQGVRAKAFRLTWKAVRELEFNRLLIWTVRSGWSLLGFHTGAY